jgi:hypothetical protein
MNKKRMQKLADFFYSSDDSKKVPLRISIITGRYSGSDLTKENFIKLLSVLNISNNLKEDLSEFLEDMGEEE